jgi:hypothetical protein
MHTQLKLEALRGIDHLADLGKNRMILQWNLEERVQVVTGFNWLRILYISRLL